jgi:hypothetical protein
MKKHVFFFSVYFLFSGCNASSSAPPFHNEVLAEMNMLITDRLTEITLVSPHEVSDCMIGSWRLSASFEEPDRPAYAQTLIGNQCDSPFTILNRYEGVADVIARFDTADGIATWCGAFSEFTDDWVPLTVEPGEVVELRTFMVPGTLHDNKTESGGLVIAWPRPDAGPPDMCCTRECDSQTRIVEHFDIDLDQQKQSYLTEVLKRK